MDSCLEQLKKALESAVEGMSSEQLRWHPADKWCAAEVLEHLYLTYTGTIRGFEKVIESGKPLATRPSLTHRLRTFVAVGLAPLPQGRTAPAHTPAERPAAGTGRSAVGAQITAVGGIHGQCDWPLLRRVRLLAPYI